MGGDITKTTSGLRAPSSRLRRHGTPYPRQYWNCAAWVGKSDEPTIENDLTFDELERKILRPWHDGHQFILGGVVIRSQGDVRQIFVKQTDRSLDQYRAEADRQQAAQRARDRINGIAIVGMYIDPRFTALHGGTDYTSELLSEKITERGSRAPHHRLRSQFSFATAFIT